MWEGWYKMKRNGWRMTSKVRLDIQVVWVTPSSGFTFSWGISPQQSVGYLPHEWSFFYPNFNLRVDSLWQGVCRTARLRAQNCRTGSIYIVCMKLRYSPGPASKGVWHLAGNLDKVEESCIVWIGIQIATCPMNFQWNNRWNWKHAKMI